MGTAEPLTLEVVLRDAVRPLLIDAGFVRSGKCWRRESADDLVIAVIEIQKSRFRTGTVRFTFNWGATTPAWNPSFSADPRCPAECGLDGRIGFFLANPRDQWWEIKDGALGFDNDDVPVGEDPDAAMVLKAVLGDRLLPTLEGLTTVEAIIDLALVGRQGPGGGLVTIQHGLASTLGLGPFGT
jgi:hypothetical protein